MLQMEVDSKQGRVRDHKESFIEDPWFCDKNPEVSCDDPGDIEYDTSRLWVIDKPNAPKTPPNTTRSLSLRKNLSRTDVTYVMPNGKKLGAPWRWRSFWKPTRSTKISSLCQTLVSRLQRYWRTWFPEIQQVAIRRGGRRLRNRTDISFVVEVLQVCRVCTLYILCSPSLLYFFGERRVKPKSSIT
ncbi:methyl-CpG-binding domain-containing protein 4-like [Iris pallida]|uniref:Methyl-CpG-binding domain-containing protein 4-like n=1 Tax=Iris pallida TaxID=29817 RepID=A0AAX6DYY6_IRIPA|nr:methyl-CpG-binding domain-containing protein 4-like [Iris pallida]KAJ6797049.1 methyl-CpG-binding domain-containing protein 4-like [Iris pallida]